LTPKSSPGLWAPAGARSAFALPSLTTGSEPDFRAVVRPPDCPRSEKAPGDGCGPVSSTGRWHHRRQQWNTIAWAPLAGPGPQPPATVRSRLSGHAGRLWRLVAIARVPFGSRAVAVTFSVPMSSAGGTGLVGWSDRSGVQAGIEPSVDAGLITYVGIARDARYAPHLCIIDAHVTLARRETCFREGGTARPKGAASSGARVWIMPAPGYSTSGLSI
jgi:hypothetical protein